MNKKGNRSNNGRRNSKKALLLTHISAKNAFLGQFWLALASQSVPRMDQKSVFFETCRLKGSPGGPKVLQGAILATFWTHLGGILRPLETILLAFWIQNGGKKQQTEASGCLAASSKK